MDRSYRLKMEERLKENVLTIEYVINCIAKYENKINQLAYRDKQYRNAICNNHKSKLDELIEYRKPFVDLLINDYCMTIDEIKECVADVKEKNIPTKKICDQIRTIIVSGQYDIE